MCRVFDGRGGGELAVMARDVEGLGEVEFLLECDFDLQNTLQLELVML